jgi:uncharacterized membrane protein
MTAGPGFRIGDAEREAAATRLREHYAQGRLTLEEFQQRLDAVFAARTDVDLAKISADLPHTSAYPPPWPPQQPAGNTRARQPGSARQAGDARQLGTGSGPGYRRPNPVRSWAWSTFALIALAVVIIGFSWPFAGIFRPVLILFAVFTFLRKILRRVIGGGTRRGRWL